MWSCGYTPRRRDNPVAVVKTCHLVYTDATGRMVIVSFNNRAERGKFYDAELNGVACVFVDGSVLPINEGS